MSLETYTGNISDIVDTNPTGADPRSQGDDHLRGIKYTLKQSFPFGTGPLRIGPDFVQFGDSVTPANNFTLDASANNGTMKLARGNAEATTQDVMTVDAAGKPDFPQLPRNISPNGYITLPGGLIVQWGTVAPSNDGNGNFIVTYPIPFPNQIYTVTAVNGNDSAAPNMSCAVKPLVGMSSFGIRFWISSTGAGYPGSAQINWIALGR